MRLKQRGRSIVQTLAFVTCVAAPVAISTQSSSTAATSSVSGVVIVAGGDDPVPGAAVSLRHSIGGTLAGVQVLTDAGGRFVLSQVPPGRYYLIAQHASFLTGRFGAATGDELAVSIPVDTGKSWDNLRVPVHRGAAITGQLLTATGTPQSATLVSALRIDGGDGIPRRDGSVTTTTDGNGVFLLAPLRPGEYLLAALPSEPTSRKAIPLSSVVFYPGTTRQQDAQRIVLADREERAGVTFACPPPRGVEISGRVVAPAADFAAQVEIALRAVGRDPRLDTRRAAVSVGGRFAFKNLEPGRYAITARAAGDARMLSEGWWADAVVDAGEGSHSVALVLARGRSLTLNVARSPAMSGSRADLSRLLVHLTREDTGGIELLLPGQIRRLRDVVSVTALPPASYAISLHDQTSGDGDGVPMEALDLEGQPVTKFIDLSRSRQIRVSLTGTGVLTGLVNDLTGTPSRGLVWAIPLDELGNRKVDRSGNSRPGLDGIFVIHGLVPGTYLVAFVDTAEASADVRHLLGSLHPEEFLSVQVFSGKATTLNLAIRR